MAHNEKYTDIEVITVERNFLKKALYLLARPANKLKLIFDKKILRKIHRHTINEELESYEKKINEEINFR